MRIVLADPTRSSREVLLSQLESRGLHVQTATCGGDVLETCAADPPDVLIMDLALPDFDGFELCARVRRETRDADIVVIVLAQPGDSMTRSYLGQMVDFVGGDYFFVRPVDGRLLVRLVEDMRREREETRLRSQPIFPTRVVWPTAPVRRFTSVG